MFAVLIAAAALVAIYARGRSDGSAGEKKREATRMAAAEKEVLKREHNAALLAEDAARSLLAEHVKVVTRTQTLIRKVPVYVSKASDDRCIVPRGFVLLHDAAASGGEAGVSSAAGGPLEAASGIPLSAVLETVVGNYGTAYDWKAETLTWRHWYATEKAAQEKR